MKASESGGTDAHAAEVGEVIRRVEEDPAVLDLVLGLDSDREDAAGDRDRVHDGTLVDGGPVGGAAARDREGVAVDRDAVGAEVEDIDGAGLGVDDEEGVRRGVEGRDLRGRGVEDAGRVRAGQGDRDGLAGRVGGRCCRGSGGEEVVAHSAPTAVAARLRRRAEREVEVMGPSVAIADRPETNASVNAG